MYSLMQHRVTLCSVFSKRKPNESFSCYKFLFAIVVNGCGLKRDYWHEWLVIKVGMWWYGGFGYEGIKHFFIRIKAASNKRLKEISHDHLEGQLGIICVVITLAKALNMLTCLLMLKTTKACRDCYKASATGNTL